MSNSMIDRYTWTYLARHVKTKQAYLGIHQNTEGAFHESGGTSKNIAVKRALEFLQVDSRAGNEGVVERVHIRMVPPICNNPFECPIVEAYGPDGKPAEAAFPVPEHAKIKHPHRAPGVHPDLEHHEDTGFALFSEHGTLMFVGLGDEKSTYETYGASMYAEEPEEYPSVKSAVERAYANYIAMPCAVRVAVINSGGELPAPTTDWLEDNAKAE